MTWDGKYESRFLRVDPEKGRFQVSRRAYADPAVFQEEKRKVLSKHWVFVGHESEIKNPNDYVTRDFAAGKVIFARDRKGKVHAFLNVCPHRGAIICRDRAGNRKTFSCPYHGWTFRNSGELIDQSCKYGYSEAFNDDGRYNLAEIKRLDERSGFYFLNFDAQGTQGLDEFLGSAGDFLDMINAHSQAGMEVIEGVHEYRINANYKLLCENSYDGYHLGPTHASFVDFLGVMLKGTDPTDYVSNTRAFCNGHAAFETGIRAGRPIAQGLPSWGEEINAEIEKKRREVYSRLGEEKAEQVCNYHRNMVLFPNSIINDQQTPLLRTITPISENEMIVRAYAMGCVDDSDIIRGIRLEGMLSFLGPSGFATPDDIEMLELAQTGYANDMALWNDMSKGFNAAENTATSRIEVYDNELQMRAYWLAWDRAMAAEDRPTH